MRYAVAALTFMIVAIPMAACARTTTQTAGGEVALRDSTMLVVDNQSLNDMTIYVLEGGSTRRRLGTASGARRTQLSIPRTLVGTGRELQFLADPFAGRGNSVSQRIWVAPGDRVGITILP